MFIFHPSPSNRLTLCLATAMLLCLSLLLSESAHGRIYKYKKDGIWYFTDDPSQVPAEYLENETQAKPQGQQQASRSPARLLLAGYPASNAIETAAKATVAVESTAGYGSGFFITDQGHIITNKHVVRPVPETTAGQEKYFTRMQSRIKEVSRRLEDERRRLKRAENSIKRLEELASKESDPSLKKTYQEQHADDMATYRSWKSDFQQRLDRFETEKAKFEEQLRQYTYRKSIANLSQTFTIYLADRTQLYVRLEAVSNQHDLALLKLDGYQTPYLRPGSSYSISQGDPVYAIGNPAKLHNSVTSGVFSGYENGFLQTNAQIYPGNSGGPLVDNRGRVLGINTFKKLTRKFEGLGFAIPIEVVWKDFSGHLPPGQSRQNFGK